MRRRTLVTLRAAASLALAGLTAVCGVAAPRPARAAGPITALVGGRVQPTPDAGPIEDGVVVIDGAVISAVGSRRNVTVPAGATVVDCAGATVMAGFWNSHVHFLEPEWQDAAHAPADRLTAAFAGMLTRYGFVHVVDLSSRPDNTLALRRRVERGDVLGPSILTAGVGFAPAGGSPYYILPGRLPELARPEDSAAVTAALERGADVLKLVTGSWAAQDRIVVMPVAVVRAATRAAHDRGRIVFAHPSNSAGARVAIEGGVDVLAHVFPTELDRSTWDRALPALMRERGMALVPTLKLWPYELGRLGRSPSAIDAVLGTAEAHLRAFSELGGQILFGTDVGYMRDHDPTDEYVYMQAAGFSYAQIVASLTTSPAERLRVPNTGRLAPGLQADIAVVDGDPAANIRALARARYTLRAGRIIYRATPPATPDTSRARS